MKKLSEVRIKLRDFGVQEGDHVIFTIAEWQSIDASAIELEEELEKYKDGTWVKVRSKSVARRLEAQYEDSDDG